MVLIVLFGIWTRGMIGVVVVGILLDGVFGIPESSLLLYTYTSLLSVLVGYGVHRFTRPHLRYM
jgi:sensor histidine kinase regulating citrate/malate metabolism